MIDDFVQSDAEARVAHLKLRLARIQAGKKMSKLQRLSYEDSLRIEREARRIDLMLELNASPAQR